MMSNVLFYVYVSAMSYKLFCEKKNEIKIDLHICVISKLKKIISKSESEVKFIILS